MPKNYRDVFGFDALVVRYRGALYVTNIETGFTHAVSWSDTQSLRPTVEQAADVIADRVALDVSRDTSIDKYYGN